MYPGGVPVHRVLAVVIYVIARLVLAGCRRIGRSFHVGAMPIASTLTLGAVAAVAGTHLVVLNERGAQPIVILALTVPALAAAIIALAWRRWSYDEAKAAHRWDGWIDN